MTPTEAIQRITKAAKAMRFASESFHGIAGIGAIIEYDIDQRTAALEAYAAVAQIHADEITKATRSLTAQSA